MCVRTEAVRAWMGGCWPATNAWVIRARGSAWWCGETGAKCLVRSTRVSLRLLGGQLPGFVLSMRRSYPSSARRSASISSAASRALIGTMSSTCNSIGWVGLRTCVGVSGMRSPPDSGWRGASRSLRRRAPGRAGGCGPGVGRCGRRVDAGHVPRSRVGASWLRVHCPGLSRSRIPGRPSGAGPGAKRGVIGDLVSARVGSAVAGRVGRFCGGLGTAPARSGSGCPRAVPLGLGGPVAPCGMLRRSSGRGCVRCPDHDRSRRGRPRAAHRR